jgi:hypothetical protein
MSSWHGGSRAPVLTVDMHCCTSLVLTHIERWSDMLTATSLVQFLEVDDSILAYRFMYPVLSASGKKIPIIFSRRPERYSSAAPLSVDARQRIVTSLTSLQDAITISVSVRSSLQKQSCAAQSHTDPNLQCRPGCRSSTAHFCSLCRLDRRQECWPKPHVTAGQRSRLQKPCWRTGLRRE